MKVLMNGLSIHRPVDSPNSIIHIFLPGNAELKWSRKSLFESPTLESQTTFFQDGFICTAESHVQHVNNSCVCRYYNPISFVERCSGRSHHPKWHPPPPHMPPIHNPPLPLLSLAPAVAQIPGDGSSLIEISPSAAYYIEPSLIEISANLFPNICICVGQLVRSAPKCGRPRI